MNKEDYIKSSLHVTSIIRIKRSGTIYHTPYNSHSSSLNFFLYKQRPNSLVYHYQFDATQSRPYENLHPRRDDPLLSQWARASQPPPSCFLQRQRTRQPSILHLLPLLLTAAHCFPSSIPRPPGSSSPSWKGSAYT